MQISNKYTLYCPIKLAKVWTLTYTGYVTLEWVFLCNKMIEDVIKICTALYHVVYKFIFPFLESLPKKKHIYIGYTTTIISRRLTYLSENSTIKQDLIIKHNNNTDQLTSFDVRKILTDNSIIIYKNNNKERLQILEAIYIKNKRINIHKIAFNTGTNILNVFNN